MVIFISSGLVKLLEVEGGMTEMRTVGLHPDGLFTLASAVMLLGGVALIPLNRWVWLGAGMLSVFLTLIIAIVHTFWTMSATSMQISLYFALEHITVIGGLWVTAIASRLRQRLAYTREAA